MPEIPTRTVALQVPDSWYRAPDHAGVWQVWDFTNPARPVPVTAVILAGYRCHTNLHEALVAAVPPHPDLCGTCGAIGDACECAPDPAVPWGCTYTTAPWTGTFDHPRGEQP